MVKWIPPLMGWAKLNTDGSFIGNTWWLGRESHSGLLGFGLEVILRPLVLQLVFKLN